MNQNNFSKLTSLKLLKIKLKSSFNNGLNKTKEYLAFIKLYKAEWGEDKPVAIRISSDGLNFDYEYRFDSIEDFNKKFQVVEFYNIPLDDILIKKDFSNPKSYKEPNINKSVILYGGVKSSNKNKK